MINCFYFYLVCTTFFCHSLSGLEFLDVHIEEELGRALSFHQPPESTQYLLTFQSYHLIL